ncbi:signal recognition particle-docking protein FtsY [bacterium]|nr:signal recognition particle-docking protein FtsY [bacterium]
MFSNLFKRSSENEAKEDKQQEEQTAAEIAEKTPETEEQDGAEEPEAEADGEEAAEADGDEEPEETKETAKGLRGLWEKTRRLASTPVDPWFSKISQGLDKTRRQFVGRISNLFSTSGKIDEEFWEELEDILLTSDVGLKAANTILDELRRVQKEKKIKDPQELNNEIKVIISRILQAEAGNNGLHPDKDKLTVIMMVGVNGTGKTTTTAKLASKFREEGHKVLLAAADTFRAAAIDQLQVWADRIKIDLIRHQEGSDPGAVVFDAIEAAKARGCSIVLIDTAGRLHNKNNLMEELRKIKRVANKACPGAPHETLLVLDATTGQNALEQARVFNNVTELTGLIMCKLDGTGKGGVVVGIGQEFNIPVRYIGVGEAIDDLREFNPEQFLDALFAAPDNYKNIEKLEQEEAAAEEE